MVDRQGSKIVENVSQIRCGDEIDSDTMPCKVVSENNLPRTYRNIKEVDTDGVKSDDQQQSDKEYRFREPVYCEIVFGSELNMIECRD